MFDLPDEEILPLSKEHVFYTWSAQAKVKPIPLKRAMGVYFWDINDKRYLDFNSMTMCVNVGLNVPECRLNVLECRLNVMECKTTRLPQA